KETFQQKELFVRQEFNPLVPENKKVYLNGSFEQALVGSQAYGEKTPNLDLLVTQTLYQAYLKNNKTKITFGIFFVVLDLQINGTKLIGNELVRLAFDRILFYLERTTDVFVILMGNEATAANLVRTISLAERSEFVATINLVGLTHGYSGETAHGFVTAVNSEVALINGDDLETLFTIEGIETITKLNFVLFPFCDLGKEMDVFGKSSVLGFLKRSAPSANIVYFQNAVAVDRNYLALLDGLLLEGEWRLSKDEYIIPILLVDETGKQVIAEETIILEEEIVFSNQTIPANLTYLSTETSDVVNDTATYLGFGRRLSRSSPGTVRIARVQTKVTMKVTPKPQLPKPSIKTNIAKSKVSLSISSPNLRRITPVPRPNPIPVLPPPSSG
ncbi:MAG: hypothetical protein D6732_13320, partial [Methanobacteriota archaeon]